MHNHTDVSTTFPPVHGGKEAMRAAIAEAGMALLAEAGPRAASIRGIAEYAALPPPTLQHHYPSKKLLYQSLYALAAERHLDASLCALKGLAPLGAAPGLLAPAAGALLGTWLSTARGPTLVTIQFLVEAARDAAYAPLARAWSAKLADGIAAALGCPARSARFTVELLAGLALASAMAGRALELDILNREILDFALGGKPTEDPGRWHRAFRAASAPQAAQDTEWQARPSARAALDAGIVLLAEAGAQALTYRHIAKRAAVSPSSVLYSFPNRGALVMALYREVHRRFARPFTGREPDEAPGDPAIAALFARMIAEERAGNAPLVLTSCELFLAAAWEAELSGDAWAMRLARGAWTAQDGDAGDFRAHVLSLWSLGVSMVHLAQHHADPRTALSETLASGLALLERPRG